MRAEAAGADGFVTKRKFATDLIPLVRKVAADMALVEIPGGTE